MKTFKIAGIEISNRYVLAPMAGFSDFSLRAMANKYGCNLVYTEMESCEALVYNSAPTIKDVKDTHLDKERNKDVKIALQCFGGKSESILKSIPLFEKYGDYDFLDFNCGCPVNKVIRQHAGSYWLNRQDELIDLLSNMVKVSSKPVIVKLRTGFDKEIDLVSLCKRIQDVGVQAIAIHGRTRNEFFQGPVNYQLIGKVKESVSIPVIANGDISLANYKDVFNITKADALMIGQNAIGYPKIFNDLIRDEEGLDISPNSLKLQLDDLKEHINYMFDTKDERSAASILRGISVRYIRNYSNSSKYRSRLVKCNTKAEYLDVINSVQNEQ